MEIMERDYKKDAHYSAAKRKVKDIKGFYIHLLVYLFINIALFVVGTREEGIVEGLGNIWNYSTAFFWGIGVLAHWASVFGPNILLGKDWEDRKIKELMQKDQRGRSSWK